MNESSFPFFLWCFHFCCQIPITGSKYINLKYNHHHWDYIDQISSKHGVHCPSSFHTDDLFIWSYLNLCLVSHICWWRLSYGSKLRIRITCRFQYLDRNEIFWKLINLIFSPLLYYVSYVVGRCIQDQNNIKVTL